MEKMGKKDKLEKLFNHIQKNPRDYQAKIAWFKKHSEQIEWERKQARIPRLRMIAECRRRLNEEYISE